MAHYDAPQYVISFFFFLKFCQVPLFYITGLLDAKKENTNLDNAKLEHRNWYNAKKGNTQVGMMQNGKLNKLA